MEQNRRRQYLEAMGIQTWMRRDADADEAQVEEATPQPVQVSEKQPVVQVKTPAEKVHKAPVPAPSRAEEVPAWMDEPPPFDADSIPADLNDDIPLDLEQGLKGRTDVARLDWKGLEQRVAECQACELHKTRTNTVFGVGDREASLMVIGEAPGADEDRQGEPFVGRAGQLLNAMLLAMGLQREQVFIANILKCRPPNNRDPRPDEALCCEPFLKRQLQLVRPKVIICVGRVAAQNLLKSQETLGRMRGRQFEYDGIPVIVSYHPAYLLRSPDQKAKAWQDLQAAAKRLG